jgi:sugar phosphate permease
LPSWFRFLSSQKTISNNDITIDSSNDNAINETNLQYDNKPIADIVINSESNESDSKTLKITELLRFPSVWAIIITQYCQSWGMAGLLSWLPTYYTENFHISLDKLMTFTALPYLLQMLVGVAAGSLADNLIESSVLSVVQVRKLLQITGMLIPALCLAYCAHPIDISSISSIEALIQGTQSPIPLSPETAMAVITTG